MENKELEKKKPENNFQEETKREKNIPTKLNEDSWENVAGGSIALILYEC